MSLQGFLALLLFFVLLRYSKLVFHSHVCFDIFHLHLILNQVQSKKNSEDCIFHLIFPSPPPIVVLSWLCLVSQAFWLAVWVEASAVGLLSVLVDGVDQHLSFGLYIRGNWVPTTFFFLLVGGLLSHFGRFFWRRLCYCSILLFTFYI